MLIKIVSHTTFSKPVGCESSPRGHCHNWPLVGESEENPRDGGGTKVFSLSRGEQSWDLVLSAYCVDDEDQTVNMYW